MGKPLSAAAVWWLANASDGCNAKAARAWSSGVTLTSASTYTPRKIRRNRDERRTFMSSPAARASARVKGRLLSKDGDAGIRQADNAFAALGRSRLRACGRLAAEPGLCA
jgi:hypothetical protein